MKLTFGLLSAVLAQAVSTKASVSRTDPTIFKVRTKLEFVLAKHSAFSRKLFYTSFIIESKSFGQSI